MKRARLRNGDVVRYDYGPGARPSRIEWFMTTSDSYETTNLTPAICIHSKDAPRIGMRFSVVRWDGDKDRLVDPSEWPDEVCRAVALFRLTGDIA